MSEIKLPKAHRRTTAIASGWCIDNNHPLNGFYISKEQSETVLEALKVGLEISGSEPWYSEEVEEINKVRSLLKESIAIFTEGK